MAEHTSVVGRKQGQWERAEQKVKKRRKKNRKKKQARVHGTTVAGQAGAVMQKSFVIQKCYLPT